MLVRVAALAVLLLAPAARAARVDVTPGPGAIQAAVDAASPGDTLRVHAGTYHEAVVIDRALRLIGAGADQVTIDGGCAAAATITVTADDVTIRDVAVTGAQELTIDVEQRDQDGVVVARNVSTGSGNYGIHADSTSDENLIARNRISGSGVFDVFDEGTSNCWRGNTYATGTPNPNGC